MKHFRRLFFILVPVLILLDQATKAAIRVGLPLDSMPDGVRRYKVVVIEGFFNIVHVKNPGAAWGILGEASLTTRMLFFTTVTLLAFVMIVGYYRQLRSTDRLLAISLCCVFAGAAGNFMDRLYERVVTDFLQFYLSGAPGEWVANTLGTRYWPSFNVADICINVGVGLFIWHVLFIEGKHGDAPAEDDASSAQAAAAAAE